MRACPGRYQAGAGIQKSLLGSRLRGNDESVVRQHSGFYFVHVVSSPRGFIACGGKHSPIDLRGQRGVGFNL